jgi:hypothetical protein
MAFFHDGAGAAASSRRTGRAAAAGRDAAAAEHVGRAKPDGGLDRRGAVGELLHAARRQRVAVAALGVRL